jgi:maltose O-acetyltransferase
MKTEKEKMIAGEMYKPHDKELIEARERAHGLAHMYNDLEDAEARSELIRQIFGSTGEEIKVEPSIRVDYGFNVHVGETFYANFDCIFLDICPIRIGRNAMLGPRVSLVTAEHPLNPVERNSGLEFGRPITIGDNCWIGSDATIIGGVTLGDNVVVGAGSVVTKSFPDNVVIAGNPARIIKKVEGKGTGLKNLLKVDD